MDLAGLASLALALASPHSAIVGDRTADGFQNVLDVAVARGLKDPGPIIPVAGTQELLIIEPSVVSTTSADVFVTTIRISESSTAFFGYSVELEVVPLDGSTGEMFAVEADFDLAQNLIEACPCGAELDPVFSVAIVNADGTAFVSGNTADGSAVVPAIGVNDSLARICLKTTADASGIFELRLGPASALANGDGDSVPFETIVVQVQVFPNPADINGDGIVGFEDVLAILAAWGMCPDLPGPCVEDIDGDGVVGFSDILAVTSAWGTSGDSCPF